MPFKETDKEIIFIEVLKKDTIADLVKFKKNSIFSKYGVKIDGLDKLAEALTKLMSDSIKANLLEYLDDIIANDEEEENKKGDADVKSK